MSVYGIRIKDADGDAVILSSGISNIIDVGNETMPDSPLDTDKYYLDIDLPGDSDIPIDNVSCIINAFRMNINIYSALYTDTGNYMMTNFIEDSVSNYTKNLSTGDMTYFVPGKCSKATTSSDWNLVCSIYPEIYWDKFSDTEVTDVKMFGAMRYLSHDVSDGFIDLYQLGSNGVNQLDYIIEMRRRVA